jgi:hypothetical protein
MALSTYANIKTALGDWMLNRGTSDLTAGRVDDFFTIVHRKIFYGCMEPGYESEALRIRAMETTADLTISSQTVALPTRYVQNRRLYLNADPKILMEQVAPEMVYELYPESTTGEPRVYAIEGENIVFGPTPDATYTGKQLYYQTFAALSADADTNWLVANAPDVYLFGALSEFCHFDGEVDEAARWAGRFAGAIRALNASNHKDRYSGAAMRSRPAVWTP